MRRLIDADDLIQWWQEFADAGYSTPMACIVQNLKDAPTIDAVEVVRCRDCKHFVDEGFYCAQNILPMFDHFYCYYGERKEGE